MRTLEYEKGFFCLRDDGILLARMKEGVEMTIDDVYEFIDFLEKYGSGKVPLLVDRCRSYSHSFLFQINMKQVIGEYSSAMAIVCSDPVAVRATQYQLEFGIPFPPDMPTKIFQSEEEAVDWLKQFLVPSDV